MTLDDWLSLGILVAVVGSALLARQRHQRHVAARVDTAFNQGFHAGETAVHARLGVQLVVNQSQHGVGNVTTGDDNDNNDGPGVDDHDAVAYYWPVLGGDGPGVGRVLGVADRPSDDGFGVPVRVPRRSHDGDPRAGGGPALRPVPRGLGRGPGA